LAPWFFVLSKINFRFPPSLSGATRKRQKKWSESLSHLPTTQIWSAAHT
jgi:hypothetical protein